MNNHTDMSEKYSGTRAVAPEHSFDADRLTRFMRDHVEGFTGGIDVRQFKGGQSNPTFLIHAESGKEYVLRCKPPGHLLPSAHAVEREFQVITALGNSDVPVPKTYALCEDASVIGTAFYIMDCVQGRIMWDPRLPDMSKQARADIYYELNRVIAALHSVDFAEVGLGTYGKTENYLERQVARWTKQYRASETEKIEAMDKLIEWLPRHIPLHEKTGIVHGDYRLDNVVFHPTEPRIIAVLDWELSTLGHPLVDFAYHCMTWRLPEGEFRGLGVANYEALGIPSEQAYVSEYCMRTGREGIPDSEWEYYMVFNMFRLAGILQGIMARAMQGNASSKQASDNGRLTRPVAEEAWRRVEQFK